MHDEAKRHTIQSFFSASQAYYNYQWQSFQGVTMARPKNTQKSISPHLKLQMFKFGNIKKIDAERFPELLFNFEATCSAPKQVVHDRPAGWAT